MTRLLFFVGLSFSMYAHSGHAQPACSTPFECAELAVRTARSIQTNTDVKLTNMDESTNAKLGQLSSQIQELTTSLRSLEQRLVNSEGQYNNKLNQLEGQTSAARQRADSQRVLECETVRSNGRVASCPGNFRVTGCSAGQNKGSIEHDHRRNECVTHDNVDWTQARCCRVQSQ